MKKKALATILLQKRSDNHCWGYAGGSVELDEVVEDAAKRELFEETGLIAEKLELFGVFSGKETHYVYPNGDELEYEPSTNGKDKVEEGTVSLFSDDNATEEGTVSIFTDDNKKEEGTVSLFSDIEVIDIEQKRENMRFH